MSHQTTKHKEKARRVNHPSSLAKQCFAECFNVQILNPFVLIHENAHVELGNHNCRSIKGNNILNIGVSPIKKSGFSRLFKSVFSINISCQFNPSIRRFSLATILVIDDEKSIRTFFQKFLKIKGFDVVTACDGEDGLNAYLKNNIDLVITDLQMPGKSGIDFIQEVKALNPEQKIVATAGFRDFLDGAQKAGADAVMQKPFLIKKLDGVLDNFFKECREKNI